MSLRNQRLLRAAILFSRTIGEADGASILMGGGAAIALGSKRRETKVTQVSLLCYFDQHYLTTFTYVGP